MALTLDNVDDAHDWVELFNERHTDKFAEWDGWDIIIFYPDPRAEMEPHGAFRRGRWGTLQRVSPTSKGWSVPHNS